MNLNKSQPAPEAADETTDATSGAPNKLLLIGGVGIGVVAAGALAFVLLSGGDDVADTAAAPLPRPSVPAPTATDAATPSTSASIPTYAAKNARDPFKALVSQPAGASAGGTTGGATTAPTSGGASSGGGVITLPGRTITVTQTISPTTSPTTAPTSSPTGTATSTGTPTPSTSTTTIALPHGTQLVYIGDIVKDADGKPQSVTVYVDNKAYTGLTPQRDVAVDQQQTFGTYFMLLGLTGTTATIQYGDGSIFDVSIGEYHYVQS